MEAQGKDGEAQVREARGPHNKSDWVPEHADEGRDAARLEDGEEPLTVVGEVVQNTGGAAGSVQVTGVLHGAHDSRHQLGRAHQRPP